MPYCVAVGCKNASGGKYAVPGLSWHTFPLANRPLLDQWLHNMSRKHFFPSKTSRLCGAHFTEDSFIKDLYQEWIGKRSFRPKKLLKAGAVPTVFSHRLAPAVRKHTAERCRRLEQKKVSFFETSNIYLIMLRALGPHLDTCITPSKSLNSPPDHFMH